MKRALIGAFLLIAIIKPAAADQDRLLTLAIGTAKHVYTRADMLSRPDVGTVAIGQDVAYGKPMTFRAVPLAHLLDGMKLPVDQVLEAVASDGFVAQLPLDLVTNTDPSRAVAYIAIEDPARPWPSLPGKEASAGPFYIIWAGRQARSVRSEQWPYQVASLTTQPAPAARWPAMAVDKTLPATDPVRAGQSLFIAQCLTCHKLNGAGSADIGPDLNLPMNPTEYFQRAALHRYIRNPAALRHWPGQKMPAFDQASLSDREIDLIIRYLAYMAPRKGQ